VSYIESSDSVGFTCGKILKKIVKAKLANLSNFFKAPKLVQGIKVRNNEK
jgi:hypothetical protein